MKMNSKNSLLPRKNKMQFLLLSVVKIIARAHPKVGGINWPRNHPQALTLSMGECVCMCVSVGINCDVWRGRTLRLMSK